LQRASEAGHDHFLAPLLQIAPKQMSLFAPLPEQRIFFAKKAPGGFA
jgi:hypothetical protein